VVWARAFFAATMMTASLFCAISLSAISLGAADSYYGGSSAVDYGYGVVCTDDVAGYGCEHHRKTVPTTTTEYETTSDGGSSNRGGEVEAYSGSGTTKKKIPVGQIVGGVVGAGVAAAGVGLIAAAINQNMNTAVTTTLAGYIGDMTVPPPVVVTTPPLVVPVAPAPAVVPFTTAPYPTVAASLRKLELEPRASANKLSGADKQAVAKKGVFGMPLAFVVASISLLTCGVLAMAAFRTAGKKRKSTVSVMTNREYEQVAADLL
jgi:hypothetical protein